MQPCMLDTQAGFELISFWCRIHQADYILHHGREGEANCKSRLNKHGASLRPERSLNKTVI